MCLCNNMCDNAIIRQLSLSSNKDSKTLGFLQILILIFEKSVPQLLHFLYTIFCNIHFMFNKYLFSQIKCILRVFF